MMEDFVDVCRHPDQIFSEVDH